MIRIRKVFLLVIFLCSLVCCDSRPNGLVVDKKFIPEWIEHHDSETTTSIDGDGDVSFDYEPAYDEVHEERFVVYVLDDETKKVSLYIVSESLYNSSKPGDYLIKDIHDKNNVVVVHPSEIETKK